MELFTHIITVNPVATVAVAFYTLLFGGYKLLSR